MFLSIENPIITDESSFLDRLGLGAQTLLIGMVVVFAMLFIIYLAMLAMQAVFAGKSKKAAANTEKAAPADIAPPAAAEEPAADAGTDDLELVAAITAAVAAYTGDAPSSFRVVSFKKR